MTTLSRADGAAWLAAGRRAVSRLLAYGKARAWSRAACEDAVSEAIARAIGRAEHPSWWWLFRSAKGFLLQRVHARTGVHGAGVFSLASPTFRVGHDELAPDDWLAERIASPPVAWLIDVPTPADDVMFLLDVVGLSAPEVGALVGVDSRTIFGWRSGTAPTPESRARLRAIALPHRRTLAFDLGLSPDDVGEGSPLPPPRRDRRNLRARSARPVDGNLVALVAALKDRGWSLRTLAQEVGVGHATVARWGKGAPATPAQVERLRALLDAPRP